MCENPDRGTDDVVRHRYAVPSRRRRRIAEARGAPEGHVEMRNRSSKNNSGSLNNPGSVYISGRRRYDARKQVLREGGILPSGPVFLV